VRAKAKADEVLTSNVRHLAAAHGIRAVEPGQTANTFNTSSP
jgi:hypothetical protein